MQNGKTAESGRPRAGLRDRLSQASELQMLPPEILEQLLNLPDRLNATAQRTTDELGEATHRLTAALRQTVTDGIAPSAERMKRVARQLAKQQQELSETERSLAYTIERLRRQADRTQWMQTGVIVLALIAGMLGGMAAAFVILGWMR